MNKHKGLILGFSSTLLWLLFCAAFFSAGLFVMDNLTCACIGFAIGFFWGLILACIFAYFGDDPR